MCVIRPSRVVKLVQPVTLPINVRVGIIASVAERIVNIPAFTQAPRTPTVDRPSTNATNIREVLSGIELPLRVVAIPPNVPSLKVLIRLTYLGLFVSLLIEIRQLSSRPIFAIGPEIHTSA